MNSPIVLLVLLGFIGFGAAELFLPNSLNELIEVCSEQPEICKNSILPACSYWCCDKAGKETCAKLAAVDGCKLVDPSSKYAPQWKEWMWKNCAETCKLC